jgi:glutathione S-transferase
LVLSELGLDFEDIRIRDDDEVKTLPLLKPTLPFGQLPIYEEGSLRIVQSMAITRFLARRGGLYGLTIEEDALIDQVCAAHSHHTLWHHCAMLIHFAIAQILDGMTDVRLKKDPLRYFSEIDTSAKDARAQKFWDEILPLWVSCTAFMH